MNNQPGVSVNGDYPYRGNLAKKAVITTTVEPFGYVALTVQETGDGYYVAGIMQMTPKRARELAKTIKCAARLAERQVAKSEFEITP